jgi:phosphatidate cytidylyltransferase
MNNFLTRTISGAVFVGLIVGSIIWNYYAMIVVFLVFLVLMLFEFFKLNKIEKNWFFIIAGTLINLSFIITSITNWPIEYIGIFAFVFMFLIKPEQYKVFFFSLIYLALPFFLFLKLAETENKPIILLAPLILTWSNDTFAYLTGMLFGKHKFVPKISPKKTWEGVVGGIVITMILAFFAGKYFEIFNRAEWIVLAFVVSVFAILGDLFESKLKRHYNVKDSGNIMPGHGGLLDRFDAFLFVIPAYYVFSSILL